MARKKHLYSLFLVILIALKVSAVHIYVHQGHDDGCVDDCKLCEQAIYNQNIAFSTPPQFQSFEIDFTPIFCQQEMHYEGVFITTLINDIYFGRPPPSLT